MGPVEFNNSSANNDQPLESLALTAGEADRRVSVDRLQESARRVWRGADLSGLNAEAARLKGPPP